MTMTNTNTAAASTVAAAASTATAAANAAASTAAAADEKRPALSPDEPAVAIIGFGTAGVNALIGLRSAGYAGPVRVFSNIATLPYSPIITSYYAAGKKSLGQCFPWSAEELDELGAEVLMECTVEALDPASHTVTTSCGSFPYTKCVIATGSRPMAYGFPQVEGYRPLMLRTIEDAERMKAALEDPANERILVSGASMVALKTLEACLTRGKCVTLVGMSPHVLDFNAVPETAEVIEGILRDYGVELRLGMVIKTVERTEDGRFEVGFSNGDTDVFDEISVSHGMRSNLEFLPEGALEMDRALLVDEFMRTSDPDVYAAGDVVQALELISGEKRIVGIWKTAARQGAVAGKAIAAELAGRAPAPDGAYTGAIAMNTIHIMDALFISAGVMNLDENRRKEMRTEHGMTIALIYEACDGSDGCSNDGAGRGGERLVGFNIACRESEAGSRAFDTGAMLTMQVEKGCAGL